MRDNEEAAVADQEWTGWTKETTTWLAKDSRPDEALKERVAGWMEADNVMTPDHEAHLARIKARFLEAVDVKYRAGQAEHGGRMWLKRGMVKHAMNEVLDLWVYLCTLDEQLAGLSGEAED